ncbi:MAG TPA: CoA pyrophosphatase [Bacteroidota bacterium]
MASFRERLQNFFMHYHRVALPDSGLTRAAVLVPVFEKSNEPFLLLTKRTQDVEHHKGQISFPGGTSDKDDMDIVGTALRETSEEIGLASGDIEVMGTISDITIPTGFVVTPVVGYISSLPPLKINRSEVESVLEVPFSFFRTQGNKKVVKMMREGQMRDVYFFTYCGSEIWGATAAIIDAFLLDFQ